MHAASQLSRHPPRGPWLHSSTFRRPSDAGCTARRPLTHMCVLARCTTTCSWLATVVTLARLHSRLPSSSPWLYSPPSPNAQPAGQNRHHTHVLSAPSKICSCHTRHTDRPLPAQSQHEQGQADTPSLNHVRRTLQNISTALHPLWYSSDRSWVAINEKYLTFPGNAVEQ